MPVLLAATRFTAIIFSSSVKKTVRTGESGRKASTTREKRAVIAPRTKYYGGSLYSYSIDLSGRKMTYYVGPSRKTSIDMTHPIAYQ